MRQQTPGTCYLEKLLDERKAQDMLAPLVCVPHLSQLWQSASALSTDAPRLLLSRLRKQLRQYVLAQQLGCNLTMEEIKSDIEGSPTSWLLPPRASKVVNSVQVQWGIDVSAEGSRPEISKQPRHRLYSPR